MAVNLLIVQQVWADDIFGRFPAILDYVFCFSCGYELYDLGTMILQDVYTRKPYNEGVFWVHHTSMLIGYALAMVRWLSWGRGKRGLGTHGEDWMNDLVQA